MIWKPKEKELTPEEAVVIAKKELAPYWFGSPPLLAGIEHEGHSAIVPLSKDFDKKAWMIFFIDPTGFEGESAMVYAKEWYRRYHLNNLGFIIVLVPSYDYLRRPESIQKLMERQAISFPLVLDAQGALAQGLGATKLPKIVLLNKGQVIQAYEGEEEFDEIESRLQKFLRSMDRGLALLPLFYPKNAGIQDVGRYEFGYRPVLSAPMMIFPEPGFVAGDDGVRRGNYQNVKKIELENGEVIGDNPTKFVISGIWQQYAEGIATADSNAFIQLVSPSKRVSLIAAPAGKPGLEAPKITVDVNGMAVYDAIAGEDLKTDDLGETQIRVAKPLLYHILVELPKKQRVVGLRFPSAKRSPIALYGFRFGE